MITTSTIEPGKRADEPEGDPDHERDAHHGDADEQRDARAEHQPRQHVVAVSVGAERKPPGSAGIPNRRRAHGVAELLDRGMRRDEVGGQRDENDRADDGQAEHGAAIFAERSPEGGQGRWLGENADAFVRRQSERDVSGHGVSWG